MKPLSNPAMTSLGATTIIFLVWMAPLVSHVRENFFTMPGSIAAVVIPLFIFFFCIWLFWTLLLLWGRKNRLISSCVWVVLAVVLLRELLEAAYVLKPTSDPFRATPRPSTAVNLLFVILVVVLSVALLLLRRWNPHIVHRLKWFAIIVLGFVGLSGALTLAQIGMYTWQARDLNASRPLHHAVAAGFAHPPHRIVWILFDELSYRQVYEHRFPTLQLPAFDRLARESTVFTDVRPEGKLTLHVIPALLSGVPNTDIKMPMNGAPLWVQNAQTGKWQPFDQHQTVFQDALNAGYGTAVAGWVFPYCRLLPQVLDHCYWASAGQLDAGLYTTNTIAENLKTLFLQPLKDRARQLRLIHGGQEVTYDTPPELYQNLGDITTDDLNDPSISFLYFHLNVPHPLGFYNRFTRTFSMDKRSYVDNLALCDLYLAHVRSILEANGSWNNTTVIIMGDHSWRTYGWSKDSNWTAEEQLASDGGKFDDRPGYIVKLPGQNTANRIDTPFDAIRTRSLVDALIHNAITTPEQLAAWAK